jgi:hypothetical protein
MSDFEFDLDEEKRKRLHMEERREHVLAHDSETNRGSEDEHSARAHPTFDPSRYRGRGNGPVRISMMQDLQRTRGNRAVQRLLPVQRDSGGWITDIINKTKKGATDVTQKDQGIIGAIGQGIAAGVAAASYDPLLEQMWNVSVLEPLEKAEKRLQEMQSSDKRDLNALKEILSDMTNARVFVREIKNSLEDSGGDPNLIMQMRAMNNNLVAIEAGLRTHIPGKVDVSDVDEQIEAHIEEVASLGDALTEGQSKGSKKTPGSGGDNPMAARLWKSSVVEPMKKAAKLLSGYPKKEQIAEAAEALKRASQVVEAAYRVAMFDFDLNPRVDKASGLLKYLERRLLDKLGNQVPLEELISDVGTAAAVSVALGYRVSHPTSGKSGGGPLAGLGGTLIGGMVEGTPSAETK